jgi:hypothetical protein
MTADEIETRLETARRALSTAIDAAIDLAAAFDDAGDTRTANALNIYMIRDLEQWIQSQSQCGGLQDAAESLDTMIADGVL